MSSPGPSWVPEDDDAQESGNFYSGDNNHNEHDDNDSNHNDSHMDGHHFHNSGSELDLPRRAHGQQQGRSVSDGARTMLYSRVEEVLMHLNHGGSSDDALEMLARILKSNGKSTAQPASRAKSAAFSRPKTTAVDATLTNKLAKALDDRNAEFARRMDEVQSEHQQREGMLQRLLDKSARELSAALEKLRTLEHEQKTYRTEVRDLKHAHEAAQRRLRDEHAKTTESIEARAVDNFNGTVGPLKAEIQSLRTELKLLREFTTKNMGDRTLPPSFLSANSDDGVEDQNRSSLGSTFSSPLGRSRSPLRNPPQNIIHKPVDLSGVKPRIVSSLPPELRRAKNPENTPSPSRKTLSATTGSIEGTPKNWK